MTSLTTQASLTERLEGMLKGTLRKAVNPKARHHDDAGDAAHPDLLTGRTDSEDCIESASLFRLTDLPPLTYPLIIEE